MADMKTPKSRLSPSSLGTFLAQDKLQGILQKAHTLRRLQQLIADACPDIIPHCRVANINGTELILEADSAAWVMHLRFLTPSLLELVKKSSPEISKIRHQICPPTITKSTTYWEKKALSDETRVMLKQLADKISDKNLKKNLLKLARQK